MNYNILTINNITKVCDDNIYKDPSGNITDLQWFYFQIEYVFDRLGIPKYNSFTRLKYTMEQMYTILVKIYGTSINVEDDRKTLMKYGLYSEKIADTYTPKNIGGMINFQPELNETRAYVKKPIKDDYFKMSPNVESQKKIVKKLKIIGKSKSPAKISPRSSPKISDPRYQKSAIFIQNNKNTSCLNWGRFTGEKVHSGVVSALIFIYFTILQAPGSIFFSRLFQWNPSDTELKTMGVNSANEIELILEAHRLFRELGGKIQNKVLYDTNNFKSSLETIMDKFYKIYAINNSNYFYGLFENIGRSMVMQTIPNNTQKLFLFAEDNVNLNNNLRDFAFGYKIPPTDSLGRPFYEHIITHEYKSDIVNYYLDSTKLLSLYNLIDFPEYSELNIISNKKDYVYDSDLNRYFLKGRDAVIAKIKKNKFKVNFSSLLRSNTVQTPKDFYYLYSGYEKAEMNGIMYYYHIDDKGDRSKWVPLEQISKEQGFKVKNIVTEQTINGASNMLFVHLDRKFKRIKSGMIINGTNSIKIVPEEVLVLPKGKFNLNAIIVEVDNYYFTIYKCDGKYWIYDLLYDTNEHDDYIQLIGDFSKVLEYSYGAIKNVIQSNAICYLYQKMD